MRSWLKDVGKYWLADSNDVVSVDADDAVDMLVSVDWVSM